MEQIKVMVSEASDIWIKLLRQYVETDPDMVMCGEANSGMSCIMEAEDAEPDVIILGYDPSESMPPEEVIRQLNEVVPNAKIVLAVDQKDRNNVERSIGRGIHEFLLKPYNKEKVTKVIKRCMQE